MRLRSSRVLGVALLLGFLVCPSLAEERPLSNQDVVQIVKLGLGDAVVISKIKQAAAVDFRLDVDGLAQLKQSGVSAAIIEAMLSRTTPTTAPPLARTTTEESARVFVSLVTGASAQPLRLARGTLSTTGFGAAFTHMDYPGVGARVRTTDSTAYLQLRSDSPVEGAGYFLVKLDSDNKEMCRSLKLGSLKQRLSFKSKKAMQPDSDYVVPVRVSAAGDSLWKMEPLHPLEAGEYGFYIDAHALGLYYQGFAEMGGTVMPDIGDRSGQAGGLFDFAVDYR